jgi:hypothetical protein
VSRNYVYGYWEHLANERSGVAARVLRKLPRLRVACAELHYRLLNRHRYSVREWVTEVPASAGARRFRALSRTPRLLSSLLATRARRKN